MTHLDSIHAIHKYAFSKVLNFSQDCRQFFYQSQHWICNFETNTGYGIDVTGIG